MALVPAHRSALSPWLLRGRAPQPWIHAAPALVIGGVLAQVLQPTLVALPLGGWAVSLVVVALSAVLLGLAGALLHRQGAAGGSPSPRSSGHRSGRCPCTPPRR